MEKLKAFSVVKSVQAPGGSIMEVGVEVVVDVDLLILENLRKALGNKERKVNKCAGAVTVTPDACACDVYRAELLTKRKRQMEALR